MRTNGRLVVFEGVKKGKRSEDVIRRGEEARGSASGDGQVLGWLFLPLRCCVSQAGASPRAPLTDNHRRLLAAAELLLRAFSRRRGSHVSLP